MILKRNYDFVQNKKQNMFRFFQKPTPGFSKSHRHWRLLFKPGPLSFVECVNRQKARVAGSQKPARVPALSRIMAERK